MHVVPKACQNTQQLLSLSICLEKKLPTRNQYDSFESLVNCTNEVNESREGVIIKWPLNGQFHDAVTEVLTSRMAVSGVVENVVIIYMS